MAPCWFWVFPRCQPQSSFNHRGAEVAQTLPWHYKCKQERVRLKSQPRISFGDSWPLLTHQQHLAASAVPGQCLRYVSHIWATGELLLSSLYLNISMRKRMSLSFHSLSVFLGQLLCRCSPAQILLLICVCLRVGDFTQIKVQHWIIVKRKRRHSAGLSYFVLGIWVTHHTNPFPLLLLSFPHCLPSFPEHSLDLPHSVLV